MNNDIKNIFKGHFDSHDTELDTAALWQAIEAKRQPKKKKRLFAILPLCGLVLAGLFLVFSNSFKVITSSDSIAKNKRYDSIISTTQEANKNIEVSPIGTIDKISSSNENNDSKEELLRTSLPKVVSFDRASETKSAFRDVNRITTTVAINKANQKLSQNSSPVLSAILKTDFNNKSNQVGYAKPGILELSALKSMSSLRNNMYSKV